MVVVAAFSSEDGPLFQKVHFIFLSVGADFEFLVPVKLLHLGQSLKGISVLFFLSLSIDTVVVPLNNLLRGFVSLKDMQVESIVNISVLICPLKLVFEGFVVKLPAVLGEDFVIELCAGPDIELGSGGENTKSFADISDSPALQVAFVYCISCLRGKPAHWEWGSV